MLDLLPDSHIDLGDTSGWAVQMQQQQGQVKSSNVEMFKSSNAQMFKCNNKARSKVQMLKCSQVQMQQQQGQVKSSNVEMFKSSNATTTGQSKMLKY